jgi:hypothetical protein
MHESRHAPWRDWIDPVLRLVAARTCKGHGTAYVPIEAPHRRPGKPTLGSRSLQESATDSARTEQRYVLSLRVPRPLAPSWEKGRHGGAMLRLWDVGEEGATGAGGEEEVGRGQRARMASSDGELACDGRWLRRSLLSSRYSGRIWSGHHSIESSRDELLCHGGCLLLEGLRRRRDPAVGEESDRRRRNPPHQDATSWQEKRRPCACLCVARFHAHLAPRKRCRGRGGCGLAGFGYLVVEGTCDEP